MNNRSDYSRQVATAIEFQPLAELFKSVYRRKLATGDRTALAIHTGKSEEWTSRQVRQGGIPCPAARYVKWFRDLYNINPSAADALHEEVNAHVADVRGESAGPWNASVVAVSLLEQAARTIKCLIETDCANDDLPALLDLKALVETAIGRCGVGSK